MWLGALAAGIVVVTGAVVESASVSRLDSFVNFEVHLQVRHEITEQAFAITALAATRTAIAVTLLAVTVLAAIRHWRGALTVGLSFCLTQVGVDLMKLLVERPRPAEAVTHTTGSSFPSAHTATGMAVYGAITLVVAHSVRGAARIATIAVGGGLVVAVGLTRIYLGAHYPTDVLAGWLTGAAVVLLVWTAARRLHRRTPA